MITQEKNISKIKELIKKSEKNKLKEQIILDVSDSDFARKAIENLKNITLINLEYVKEKDSLKQISSGLNDYLCKTASKNNINIAVDLNKFISLSKEQKAKILPKIIQNIKLCRKSKTQLKILTKNLEKSKKSQIFSFLISLGTDTSMAKQAVS